MAMEYSEKVMEHFAHPHIVGTLEDANGVGEVGNAKCGDIMRMYLKISDDEVIEDVKFQTFGCASAIATSSIATDMIKGRPLKDALTLTNKAVVEALDGLPAVKIHCSVLAEQAVKAAVADYYKRKGIPFESPCDQCGGEGCCGHDHGRGERPNGSDHSGAFFLPIPLISHEGRRSAAGQPVTLSSFRPPAAAATAAAPGGRRPASPPPWQRGRAPCRRGPAATPGPPPPAPAGCV